MLRLFAWSKDNRVLNHPIDIMEYSSLYTSLQQLQAGHPNGSSLVIDGIRLVSLPFVSDGAPAQSDFDLCDGKALIQSDEVNGNRYFDYHMFQPESFVKYKSCIILLHGLNERSWDKYFPWGYALSKLTGKAVILFPISYHINRSPSAWSNPRLMKQFVEERLRRLPQTSSLSIANVALSERLEQHPERFVLSGYQAASDLVKLVCAIQMGEHPRFEKDAQVDFFGYSIGALLAQVLMLNGSSGLFDSSKFFLFCGGSALQGMNGVSRYIMDSVSYDNMYSFYLNDAGHYPGQNRLFDDVLHGTTLGTAFKKMIRFSSRSGSSWFSAWRDRMQVVSLKGDVVIPTSSINQTLPHGMCHEMHFDFQYSHENPFPLYSINSSKLMEKVSGSFQVLFERAASFFMVPC